LNQTTHGKKRTGNLLREWWSDTINRLSSSGLNTIIRVGDDAEDLDLMTLQDVLIMGKEYGDARAGWGKTRD